MADVGAHAASPKDVDAIAHGPSTGDAPTAVFTIPVVEDVLAVSKRTVESGGLRLRKSVSRVEETVEEPLRRQTVDVERRPVGRLLDGLEPPAARQEGDTLVVSVVEEVLVTEKRLMLVEEIRIRRTESEYRDPRHVVLRKEQVSIERLDVLPSDQSRPGRADHRLRPSPRPAGHSQESSMQSTLVGLFDTQDEAEQARTTLTAAGFDASVSSTASEAGALGGGSTATGLAADSAAGAIGTTAGPAGLPPAEHEGVITRFLHKLFGSDDDTDVAGQSRTYREAFRRGAYAVTVDAMSDAEIDRAEAILNACGAVDIDERSATWREEGWESPAASGSFASAAATSAGTGVGTTTAAATGAVSTGDNQTLNVVEEELQVGKRAVSRGGVRVFSRIVEVPVQESVSLTEEHATVSRRPVDRPATEADLTAFKEGTMEVRDTAEEVVVSKSARVVEEVEIGKQVTHRDETVNDTVRRTEVDVERVPADTNVGTSHASTTAAPSSPPTTTSRTL